jgi:hypothetical protein
MRANTVRPYIRTNPLRSCGIVGLSVTWYNTINKTNHKEDGV